MFILILLSHFHVHARDFKVLYYTILVMLKGLATKTHSCDYGMIIREGQVQCHGIISALEPGRMAPKRWSLRVCGNRAKTWGMVGRRRGRNEWQNKKAESSAAVSGSSYASLPETGKYSEPKSCANWDTDIPQEPNTSFMTQSSVPRTMSSFTFGNTYCL